MLSNILAFLKNHGIALALLVLSAAIVLKDKIAAVTPPAKPPIVKPADKPVDGPPDKPPVVPPTPPGGTPPGGTPPAPPSPVVTPPSPVVTPGGPPTPRPPLVLVASEYARTMAPAFADIAGRIKSGELKDKASVVMALGQHSAPLAQTLEATFAQFTNPSGAITDAAGLADVMGQVAQAIGGGN